MLSQWGVRLRVGVSVVVVGVVVYYKLVINGFGREVYACGAVGVCSVH